MKKKVLVFNGYYLPAKKYGGPTTSLVSIVDNCSDDFDFYIIAANHDLNETKVFDNIHEGWNKVGKANVLYINLNDINYNFRAIRKLLLEVKPNLVWLVGILVPADKWFVSYECRKLNIPYLISPRGEVCENTFHMKYAKKKLVSTIANVFKVYRGAYYHATSAEEKNGLIKYFHAPKSRIFLVPNIASNLKAESRTIKKNVGELRIVFISRIQEKKNLLLAIKAVNGLKGDVIFDIYGPIESEDYWCLCLEQIALSPNNIHIEYKGQLAPTQVSDAFKKYHCFLFPTLSENYGHVIVEALSSSCPVVLSRGTTPWDDLNEKAGYTCSLSEEKSFTDRLQNVCDMNQKNYNSLMDETMIYYDNKIRSDGAVEGHISMLMDLSK